MKRSEMVQFIQEELMEILEFRQYTNESIEDYSKRKAQSMLSMIEGFGMQPPDAFFPETSDIYEGFYPYWETEDETK
jgi:hypothetical protein